MNISKINSGTLKGMEVKTYIPEEIKKEDQIGPKPEVRADKIDAEEAAFSLNWQRDILLDALEKLENTVQPDNNHPLDTQTNQPIETYEEALIELQYVNTPKFVLEASGAQANINAESIIELFAEEPELVH
jgi:rhodanese-related sulfurtransferase